MKIKFTLAFLLITMLLAGCSNKNDNQNTDSDSGAVSQNTENKAEAEVKVQSGGTLNLSMRTTQTLNPLLNEDETVDNILKLIYEPLININEHFKPEPSLAESWDFADDGSSIVIKIKSGLKWQDGSSIDADDLIFSLNTIKGASENSVYKKCVENIGSYSKQDSLTVSIHFKSVYSGNIYYLAFPLISSNYYAGENVLTSSKNMSPMGNGAYKFNTFVPAKSLKLVKSVGAIKGEPNIDSVNVMITPDKETDLYSFSQGIIDSVKTIETDIGKYDNIANSKRYEYSTNYYDFIGFNFNNSILQDKNVRKAIAYAVPKGNIIEGIYLNHAAAAETPINPNSWLYEKDCEKYNYNLNTAKKLLEDSGWKINGTEKYRFQKINEYSAPLKLSILVNAENDERTQIAQKLSEELRSIGFDVSIDKVAYDEYSQRLNEKKFDIFIGGWEMSPIPDLSFMFSSNQILNGSNYISYNNAEMDNIIWASNNSIGETSMLSAYSNLQKYIAEELPYISLVFRNSAVFTNEKVNGITSPTDNNMFNDINKWFLSENR